MMHTKKLTWEEMEDRRKKGLCYNCDEKFVHGHRCTQQKLYLLDADAPSEEEYESAPEEMTKEVLDEEAPVISYNALFGFTTPQTMKVKGFFKNALSSYYWIWVVIIISLIHGWLRLLTITSIP